MALTLDQYATYLDTRDLTWPAPPQVQRPKAKAHLERLPDIRAVTWNVYGTLLAVAGGDLLFQHPTDFVMDLALDRTIQEFRMWHAMTRKPGAPTDYLRRVYNQLLDEQRLIPGGTEKAPEVASERLWEAFVRKLLKKEYQFDCSFYGSLNEYSRKIAYFFHASLQGLAGYAGLAAALRHVVHSGLLQGLIADGQCFTPAQLRRAVVAQDAGANLTDFFDDELCAYSCTLRARKPSERLFRQVLGALAARGVRPDQVLHVGSRITQDIVPARRLGMKTALFAGDKASLQATPEQLKEPASRPDVLLTELGQIAEVVPGP